MPLIEIEDDTFVAKTFRTSNNEDYQRLEAMRPNDVVHLVPPETIDENSFTKWRNALGAKCRKLSQQRCLHYTVTVGEAKCTGGIRQVVQVDCKQLKTKVIGISTKTPPIASGAN